MRQSSSALLAEIDRSPLPAERSARVALRLADLLIEVERGVDADTIGLFDTIMGRVIRTAPLETREEVAHRLADTYAAPPRLLRTLAFDEISVAAPVLSRSPRLGDADLMALALVRGRDHLLAICRRRELSEAVTDILVARDEGDVSQAVANHRGARLSDGTVATLVARARVDGPLADALGARTDLSPGQVRDLVDASRARERNLLVASLRFEAGPEIVVPPPDEAAARRAAQNAIEGLAALDRLDEAQLAAFARDGRRHETIAALSHLTSLPAIYVTGLFAERDNDLLLAIARSFDWSWETLAAMMRLRDPALQEVHQFWRADEMFRNMPVATARQALRFVQIRHAAPATPSRGGARPLHTRVKVR